MELEIPAKKNKESSSSVSSEILQIVKDCGIQDGNLKPMLEEQESPEWGESLKDFLGKLKLEESDYKMKIKALVEQHRDTYQQTCFDVVFYFWSEKYKLEGLSSEIK